MKDYLPSEFSPKQKCEAFIETFEKYREKSYGL